jgi:ComF family protein
VLDRALKRLRDGLISIAYPASCHICSRPVESIEDGVTCAPCWNETVTTLLLDCFAGCAKCGAPLSSTPQSTLNRDSDSGSEPESYGQRYCGSCTAAPFTLARSCGLYAGALEASILFLKTHPYVCARLRRILCQTVRRQHEELAADVVIPVPLHRLRERTRGFNQAEIIARSVSTELGLPVDDRTLVRTRHTERHRAGMDAIERRRSVEGAFEVVRPRRIEGAAVLLVDDLYTTGSTLTSAAEALLRAGASRAAVLTIARVTPTGSRRPN